MRCGIRVRGLASICVVECCVGNLVQPAVREKEVHIVARRKKRRAAEAAAGTGQWADSKQAVMALVRRLFAILLLANWAMARFWWQRRDRNLLLPLQLLSQDA